MATLQTLEFMNQLDDDSDWNKLDEEGESSSEDDYDKDRDEMDYLAVAQVLYRSFLILIRALRCFLKYYSLSFAEDEFSKCVTFTTAHACLSDSFGTFSE